MVVIDRSVLDYLLNEYATPCIKAEIKYLIRKKIKLPDPRFLISIFQFIVDEYIRLEVESFIKYNYLLPKMISKIIV